jgi:cation:H+ antiporter
MTFRRLFPVFLAIGITLPGFALRIAHVSAPAPLVALIAGSAILGAACILLWACDAAQADISAALALAIVALVAVAPEYAVDMYFTWQAGRHPEGRYAQYAVANMTGANRLLIGVAWSLVAAVFWLKARRPVALDSDRRTELLFLGMATVYAFVIPIKGSLAWYDGVVFLGIYAWYMALTSRRPFQVPEVHGPAEVVVALPPRPRRMATVSLFLVALLAILANAGPFSEGLIRTGSLLRIDQFVLVQWLAPIASEAPEFVVALMFAIRGKAGMALGSLLCAKLNQWTLLVGMIPPVYAASHGTWMHPIPMGATQLHEILLTAAQSLLGVVVLGALRLSVGHAILLFALFVGQLVTPEFILYYPQTFPWHMSGDGVHRLYTVMYLVAVAALVLDSPRRVWQLGRGLEPAGAVDPSSVRPPGESA